MGLYLKEAQRVVGEVAQIFGYMKKFDELFTTCLSEEIAQSSQMKEPKAVFNVTALGDVNYEGIFESADVADPTKLVVPLVAVKDIDLLADKDVFEVLSSLKERYNKEKLKILENLDQIAIDFDKKLVEVVSKITEKKEENKTKAAKEFLELDIATKKQKLLDKLLESKNENS